MHLASNSGHSSVGRDYVQGFGFAYIFESHATIRKLVLSHLRQGGAATLRPVNRAVRAAINLQVSSIKCDVQTPRFESELAVVFPAATKLCVRSATFVEPDACVLLEHILATSPVLLAKLQALELSLGTIDSCEDITPAVSDFLCRCDHAVKSRASLPTMRHALMHVSRILSFV
jgi:hypothetical protein